MTSNEKENQTSVVPFNYDNGVEVRTTTIDGEPWFVALDICNALGLVNSRKSVSSLDADQVMVSPFVTPSNGGVQQMQVVNESGLYTLIIRSNKPAARAFRKWVTSEVIPAIRKTGVYALASASSVVPDAIELDGYAELVALVRRALPSAGNQARLARYIGCSDATLSVLLKGQTGQLSIDLAYRIRVKCTRLLPEHTLSDLELAQWNGRMLDLVAQVEDKQVRSQLRGELQVFYKNYAAARLAQKGVGVC